VQNRLIKNLSKGYRQRVGLAQAILGFPEVIILDEPMVGLDPKQIIEVRELIKKLSENHTVILSSHILSEISAICDHIMIISKGKLVASDTPENLISLMKGSATLELTVCGSKSAVQKLTERFPEISDLQITDSTEEGAFDLTIRTESGVDLREKLFYYLAEQKMTLLRMQHSHVSLEDVFLELTENGADPEQAGEEEHASKKFGRGSDAEHAPEDSEKKTAGRFSMKHFRNKSAKTTEQETGKEDM
jgi:ABC-2 type transport system ATP-binding protein